MTDFSRWRPKKTLKIKKKEREEMRFSSIPHFFFFFHVCSFIKKES